MKKDNLNYMISILSNSNRWFSASELAALTHTTTRTVRNYIAEINKRYPSHPLLSSHAGYLWDRNASNTGYITPELENITPETPEDRLWYILREAAYGDGTSDRPTILLSSLCDILNISDKTLETDIDSTRKSLRAYGLRLHIRQGQLSLSGKESKLRLLIYDIICHFNMPLLTVPDIVISFPLDPVAQLQEYLAKVLAEHDLAVDAYHEAPLLLLILIQSYRIRGGKTVLTDDLTISEPEKLPEHAVAEACIVFLSSYLHIHYSQQEANYLTMLLFCFCHNTCFFPEQYPTERKMIIECLSHLNHNENIDFLEEDFLNHLTDFFVRLRVRCNVGFSAENPLITQVRTASPLIQDEASWIMTTFRKEWQIDPDQNELGWLTLLLSIFIRKKKSHFPTIGCTLVAPEFDSLDEFLCERLETHFGGQLRIDHVLRSCDTTVIPRSDMILSVLTLKNISRYILISPTLTPQDYAAIRQEINRLEHKRQYTAFGLYLKCYSSPLFFKRDCNFASSTEVIDTLCSELEEQGYTDPSFREQLLAREAADPTSYYNLIAVPHATVAGVRRNTISIVLNDKPVRWGDQKVNLIVLVAMEHDLMADFREFYNMLIRLFANRKNIDKLLQAADYPSFLDIIEKLSVSNSI